MPSTISAMSGVRIWPSINTTAVTVAVVAVAVAVAAAVVVSHFCCCD